MKDSSYSQCGDLYYEDDYLLFDGTQVSRYDVSPYPKDANQALAYAIEIVRERLREEGSTLSEEDAGYLQARFRELLHEES
jgi:hypothetical protein